MTPLTQVLIRKDCRHKCERINLCCKFGNLVRWAAKQLCTCCCCWMIKALCSMNTCQLNHAVRLAVAWAVDKQPGLAPVPYTTLSAGEGCQAVKTLSMSNSVHARLFVGYRSGSWNKCPGRKCKHHDDPAGEANDCHQEAMWPSILHVAGLRRV